MFKPRTHLRLPTLPSQAAHAVSSHLPPPADAGGSTLGSHKIVAFIPTRNRGAAKTFYKDVLGLRLVSEDQFAIVFDANETMLRVTPVPEFKPHPFTILGWQTDDIERTVTELMQKGVCFENFKLSGQDERGIWNAPGARVAWFKDPDGNLLSVSQHE